MYTKIWNLSLSTSFSFPIPLIVIVLRSVPFTAPCILLDTGRYLLDSGATVDAMDRKFQTPLHLVRQVVVRVGCHHEPKIFLSSHSLSYMDAVVAHLQACQNNSADVAFLLIDSGASINSRNKKGM